MLDRNKIISSLHLIENIVLKIPIIKSIALRFENLFFNTFLTINIKEQIKEKIKYNQNLFYYFLNQIKEYDNNYNFKNKTILEIGPGKNLLLAIIFILNGAKKVYLIDKYKQIFNDKFNIKLYNQYLILHLEEYKKNIKNYFSIKEKIIYFGKESIEKINKLENNSIDFIFSHAVLEHVFNLDLTIKRIYQLLKRGGFSSHKVDLRDHFHIRDKCYLDFLKYPNKYWKFIGDTNRVRFSQYIKLFREYNFKILNVKLQKMGPILKIEEIKKKIYKDFKNLDSEILSIRGFYIFLKKE